MTKTKPQLTEVITTEESPTYKRGRMLEVRKAVAKAVKKDKRVDLMNFSGTDIARSQIALQDLLMREKEKHKKASSHIVSLKRDYDFLSLLLTRCLDTVTAMVEENANQQKLLNNAHDECHRLATGWETTMRSEYQLNRDLEAMKTTFKNLMVSSL